METAALRDLRRTLIGPDYPPSTRRPPRWLRPLRGYAVPAGLVALLGLGAAASRYVAENRNLPDPVALLAGMLSVLPVVLAVRRPLAAWRLAYPLAFLGVLGAATEESWPWNPVQLVGYLVVVFVVALCADAGVVAWVTAFSVLLPLLFVDTANAYGAVVLLVALVLVGDQVRRRRLSQHRTEQETARRSILEERTRIARELHDVVAHHMSLIAVRAETAPYRLPALPADVTGEFGAIAAAARSALTDMRQLLGVLRSDDTDAPRAPQPGLADLPALIAAARRAGVPVTADIPVSAGGPVTADDPVDAGVDDGPSGGSSGLAAYRIVQEALANAARHAPGAPVRVRVRPAGDSLAVEVRSGPGGRSGPPGPAGHGLTGMRERAVLLGGTFSAGPDDAGGFAVTATLPRDGRVQA